VAARTAPELRPDRIRAQWADLAGLLSSGAPGAWETLAASVRGITMRPTGRNGTAAYSREIQLQATARSVSVTCDCGGPLFGLPQTTLRALVSSSRGSATVRVFRPKEIATLNVRDDATVRKNPAGSPMISMLGRQRSGRTARSESPGRFPITHNAHAVSLSNVAWSKDLVPWRGLSQASVACPCGLTEVRRGRDCGFRRRGHCETARPS